MPSEFNRLEIAKLLSQSFLFSELDKAELEKVADFSKIQQVAAKKTIFSKGNHGDSMFIVIAGRLKVQNVSEEGKTFIINFLEPNATFGEIAVLDGKPRTATVVSVETSELLIIERTPFLKFLENHPHIAIKLLGEFCNMLRLTDELLESMVFFNLPTRLAKMLSILAMRYGTATFDGVAIDVKISQLDLANLVGTSRESVNRHLRNWEDEGLLKFLDHGRMEIHSKLLSIAD